MAKPRVLIPAAGSGSRSGLPYPKTLYPVYGEPILVRIIRLLHDIDPRPTVVVSPEGRREIADCLSGYGLSADLVLQEAPTGMGDAILCVQDAPGYQIDGDLLVVWGDIPLLQQTTVSAVLEAHFTEDNIFTFPTRFVDSAYTVVSRGEWSQVEALVETREAGLEPGPGERDIGLFLFKTRPVIELLRERLPQGRGRGTGEHGFLYVVEQLAKRGHRISALPIATELDIISLNRISDLAHLGTLYGKQSEML